MINRVVDNNNNNKIKIRMLIQNSVGVVGLSSMSSAVGISVDNDYIVLNLAG